MPPDQLRHALLLGDPEGVRNLCRTAENSGTETSALAFALILDSRFAEAAAAAVGSGLEIQAVTLLANTMLGDPSGLDELTASLEALDPEVRSGELWTLGIAGEAGMSAGRLDVAERLSRLAIAAAPEDDPTVVFSMQTLARALLFQGRLAEAAEAGGHAHRSAAAHGLDSLQLVARATLAYIAALRDDREQLEESVDIVLALAPECPPSYFASGAQVITSYALAAGGQGARAEEALLGGCGGPRLPLLQTVDRAYGYELLVAAALSTGDLRRARGWHRLAVRACRSDGSEMTTAALHRSTARIAAAEGDTRTSAALAETAATLADQSSGHLDATRARLLAGSALLHAADPLQAQARLRAAGVEATQMGAATLTALARRDLRSIGLRFTGADQTPMSRREREVAELMISGRTNGQIAGILGVSERTVHSHVSGVLRAFDVPSRAALARALKPSAEAALSHAMLTPRQVQVAQLAARGYTNDGIARELKVSTKTVEKHLGDCFRRLGVESRAALAARLAGQV